MAHLKRWRPDIVAMESTFAPPAPPRGHSSIDMTLSVFHELAPKLGVLTHINHRLDAWLIDNPQKFPENVVMSRDGMEIALESGHVAVTGNI